MTPRATSVEGSVSERSKPSGARIVVVDDRPRDRHLLEILLEHRGHQVFSAGDAESALELARGVRPDLLISDIVLPTLSGYELARRIRTEATLGSTRVVLTTAAMVDETVKRLAGDVGVTAIIPKPSDPETILEMVDKALGAMPMAAYRPKGYVAEDPEDPRLLAALRRTVDSLNADVARLKLEEQRSRLVIDNAGDAFVVVDGSGHIIEWNQAAARTFGWSADEAIGQDVLGLLCPAWERSRWEAAMAEVLETGASDLFDRRVELAGVHKTGRSLDLELWAWATNVGGTVTLTGCIRDIGVRKETEAALIAARDAAVEASRAKSAFLANMSHEIRTPMHGVLGMMSLLLDTELDASQREYAETVAASAEALLKVINEILDFSKIEAGMFKLDATEFDLPALVDQSCRLLTASAAQKNLRFSAHVGDEVPRNVRADEGRLRQVLNNVVGNAVKFTPTGCVAVEVSSQSSGDEAQVRVEVRDTGIGIPADKVGSLFQPFTQADDSTTRAYGGTGLGLAITKQLVELMGGACGLESEVGVGTTFWFSVPVVVVQSSEPATLRDERTAGRTPTVATPGRILLAEDSAINQLVVLRMLERAGHSVDVVTSGREAVGAVANHVYDLLLMDGQMPDMDGYEATREIRRREGTGRRIPIVALTASAMVADKQRCLSAGMDGYLSKPCRADALLEEVGRWLPCAGGEIGHMRRAA